MKKTIITFIILSVFSIIISIVVLLKSIILEEEIEKLKNNNNKEYTVYISNILDTENMPDLFIDDKGRKCTKIPDEKK